MEDEVRVNENEVEVVDQTTENSEAVDGYKDNSGSYGIMTKALLGLALGAVGGFMAARKLRKHKSDKPKTKKKLMVVEVDEDGNIVGDYSKDSEVEEKEA